MPLQLLCTAAKSVAGRLAPADAGPSVTGGDFGEVISGDAISGDAISAVISIDSGEPTVVHSNLKMPTTLRLNLDPAPDPPEPRSLEPVQDHEESATDLLNREARERKATKSDKAPVPSYLWTYGKNTC